MSTQPSTTVEPSTMEGPSWSKLIMNVITVFIILSLLGVGAVYTPLGTNLPWSRLVRGYPSNNNQWPIGLLARMPTKTQEPLATLAPTNLPKTFVVRDCSVPGEEARVEVYVIEFRLIKLGEMEVAIPQFINDAGFVLPDLFPSFKGKEFLLVCFPKETIGSWANLKKDDGRSYAEVFFDILNSRPVNEVTGEVDLTTIERGFWLFPNPDRYQREAATNRSAPVAEAYPQQTLSPLFTATLTATPFPTVTLAPTLPPPTPTPVVVVDTMDVYEQISFEDLAYNNGVAPEIWEKCEYSQLKFRQAEAAWGTIEAACPNFDDPKVYIKWVTSLSEGYRFWWFGGGGTWFSRGGTMSYGNAGGPTYVWSNSMGVKYYAVGFGFVTLSPVQLIAPTETPAPTNTLAPTNAPPTPLPTATSWNPEIGCIQTSWSFITANPLTIVNEQGDSTLIHRKDGKWFGNNNSDRCYIISGLPTTVTNLDTGEVGTWYWENFSGATIDLGWINQNSASNSGIWKVSNYVWVGIVE